MGKVIPINAAVAAPQMPLSMALDELVGYRGVLLLSRLLREHHKRNRVSVKEIAAKANLTPQTVSRIMSRDTKSPRMLTCIMLFKAIGFVAVQFE